MKSKQKVREVSEMADGIFIASLMLIVCLAIIAIEIYLKRKEGSRRAHPEEDIVTPRRRFVQRNPDPLLRARSRQARMRFRDNPEKH